MSRSVSVPEPPRCADHSASTCRGELVGAERLHQDLDARLVLVVATAERL
jgi:hypothetical protein